MYKLIAILCLGFAISSCVTPQPKPNPVGPALDAGPVECKDKKGCPTVHDFQVAERMFREEYPEADLPFIRVKWWPYQTELTTYNIKRWANHGYAHNKYWIECSSWGGWVHERIHLHHYQMGRKPDYHPPIADGSQPWQDDPADNDRETRLKRRLRIAIPAFR